MLLVNLFPYARSSNSVQSCGKVYCSAKNGMGVE